MVLWHNRVCISYTLFLYSPGGIPSPGGTFLMVLWHNRVCISHTRIALNWILKKAIICNLSIDASVVQANTGRMKARGRHFTVAMVRRHHTEVARGPLEQSGALVGVVQSRLGQVHQ